MKIQTRTLQDLLKQTTTFFEQCLVTLEERNYLGSENSLPGYLSLGGALVKYFNLPIGDINSPSYNKFTEGIDFFRQVTQTLGRALES